MVLKLDVYANIGSAAAYPTHSVEFVVRRRDAADSRICVRQGVRPIPGRARRRLRPVPNTASAASSDTSRTSSEGSQIRSRIASDGASFLRLQPAYRVCRRV